LIVRQKVSYPLNGVDQGCSAERKLEYMTGMDKQQEIERAPATHLEIVRHHFVNKTKKG
jgi:hypothetical protein